MEKEKDNLYNCILCNNKYKTTSSLNRHVRTKHDGKEQFQNSEMYQNSGEVPNQNNSSFKCIICNKEYTTMSSLNQHVKRHDEKKQFHCEVCGHSSLNNRDAKKHFEAVHEGKMPFKCDISDYNCYMKTHFH